MANMGNGEGDWLMRVITKQNRGRVVPSDTYGIIALAVFLCLVQPSYELSHHDVHTLQILNLQQAQRL